MDEGPGACVIWMMVALRFRDPSCVPHPGRAFYYPSFEMTILSQNVNLQLDNRHVRPNVVDGIMDTFDMRFVSGD